MRPFNQIRELTTVEREVLLKGTKSKMGFTVRRSHILLLNAEGQSAPTIAKRLHCSEQTVRNVIGAFNREGIGCLEEKSHRPHRDHHVFSEEGLNRLHDLVHRSPRDFKFETSLWTLDLLAQACFQEKIVPQPISYETVRRGLSYYGVKRHDTGKLYLYPCVRPNSDETVQFLHWIVMGATALRKKVVIVIWDNARWHTSRKVTRWIRRYNRDAKATGRPRLIVWALPKRNPWLNPIEPHWLHAKKRVCQPALEDFSPHLLQARVFAALNAKFIASLAQSHL